MNVYDILIGAIVLLMVLGAVWRIRKNKKQGKGCCSCSGDCSSCANKK